MSNAKDWLIADLVRRRKQMFRIENAAVGSMNGAWREARRELLDALLALYAEAGSVDARLLIGDPRLQREIEQVLLRMQARIQQVMRRFAEEARDNGLEAAARELTIFARELGVSGVELATTQGLDPVALAIVETVVDQVPGIVANTRSALTAELRRGLIAGDSFPDLVRSVLNLRLEDRASVFRRGKTSAELFVRRSIFDANNASRQLFYEGASQQVPGLQKQALATLDARTTDCCLRVHGQIHPLSEPYRLTGTPRFASEMMQPPFHWNCRTTSVAYHPDFEEGAEMNTRAMRQAAQELRGEQ